MVSFTPNISGPQATRAVPQLFYNGETQYGSFCNVKSKNDGKLFLFASTPLDQFNSDLKVAHVDPDHATDRTQYSYWDGSEWSTTQLPPTSTAGNVLSNWSGFPSGDLEYYAYLVSGYSSTSAYSQATHSTCGTR